MLWFIIFGGLAILGGIVYYIVKSVQKVNWEKEHDSTKKGLTYRYNPHHPGEAFVFTTFGILAAVLLSLFANLISSAWVGSESFYDGTWSIHQLTDSSQIEGSFFLGSGSIRQTPVYYFYAETGTDTYELHWVNASRTTIHESDSNPHIDYTGYRSENAWLNVFGAAGADGQETYDIYVPKGSIVQNYNLNGPGVDSNSPG